VNDVKLPALVAGFFMRGRMAGMPRQVYLENWQQELEKAIAEINERAGPYSSPETDALFAEREQLQELISQVRYVAPEDRLPVCSVVLALSVREPLQLPEDLISRLGELFDIYRRFRARLTWND
jgi:hypothetical protein